MTNVPGCRAIFFEEYCQIPSKEFGLIVTHVDEAGA